MLDRAMLFFSQNWKCKRRLLGSVLVVGMSVEWLLLWPKLSSVRGGICSLLRTTKAFYAVLESCPTEKTLVLWGGPHSPQTSPLAHTHIQAHKPYGHQHVHTALTTHLHWLWAASSKKPTWFEFPGKNTAALSALQPWTERAMGRPQAHRRCKLSSRYARNRFCFAHMVIFFKVVFKT